MARIRTPIISFGAKGKLARTLVFAKWKGQPTAREYVVPANPRTPDQVTKRGVFADAVAAFRNYLTNAGIRTAWNQLASAGKEPMSGFNRATQSLVNVLTGDPDASYSISYLTAAAEVAFQMRDMDDGGPPSETGNYDIWRGPSATSLLLVDSQPIVATTVTTAFIGVGGEIAYFELRKSGWSRSGIAKVTHL